MAPEINRLIKAVLEWGRKLIIPTLKLPSQIGLTGRRGHEQMSQVTASCEWLAQRVMWPGIKIQLECGGYKFVEAVSKGCESQCEVQNPWKMLLFTDMKLISLAKKMHTLFQLNVCFSCQKYICQRARIVNYAQMLILGPWWGLSTNPKSLSFFSQDIFCNLCRTHVT